VGIFVAEADYAKGIDLVAKADEVITYAKVFIWAIERGFFLNRRWRS
jgi:hypothetical protein